MIMINMITTNINTDNNETYDNDYDADVADDLSAILEVEYF